MCVLGALSFNVSAAPLEALTPLERSQAHSLKASELVKAQRYLEAIKELRLAYNALPDVKPLISIATLYDKLADCPSAYYAWLEVLESCQEGCSYQDRSKKMFFEKTAPCASVVKINSIPPARITLDQRYSLGETPKETPILYGSHLLAIEAPGYQPITRRFKNDETSEELLFDVTLEPIGAQLLGASELQTQLTPPPLKPLEPEWKPILRWTSLAFASVGAAYVGVDWVRQNRSISMNAKIGLAASGSFLMISLLSL